MKMEGGGVRGGMEGETKDRMLDGGIEKRTTTTTTTNLFFWSGLRLALSALRFITSCQVLKKGRWRKDSKGEERKVEEGMKSCRKEGEGR
jgi:hypothetical protein